jgi:hypothetical protein
MSHAPQGADGLGKVGHVGIGLTPATYLGADDPHAPWASGFYRCRSMTDSDQVPPLSHQARKGGHRPEKGDTTDFG